MYPFAARKTLFGLWQNKENIRTSDRAIITEGQLDVISAWQNGLNIVTSSFGAHGSLDHLVILSRYAKRIDVLYDDDAAGYKGVQGIKSLSTTGDLDIRFKNPFKNGEDLDSWIKKNNSEKLINILDMDDIDLLKRKLIFMEDKI
jgi:DNA primase